MDREVVLPVLFLF